MNSSRLPLVVLAALAISSPAFAGQISATTYSNDFTSSASDFTQSRRIGNNAATTPGPWTLNTSGSGTLGHYDTDVAILATYSASVEHTLLGGSAASAQNFSLTASGVYTRSTTSIGTGSYMGVSFLNSGATLNDNLNNTLGYTLYIRGTTTTLGTDTYSIFLDRAGTLVAGAGDASAELRDFKDKTLAFSVTASYIDLAGSDGVNDALSITATVTNVTDAVSFSFSYIDATPLVGTRFGLRASDTNSSHDMSVQWDSFGLTAGAIPEPSSAAALAGLFGLGVAALRRRRR